MPTKVAMMMCPRGRRRRCAREDDLHIYRDREGVDGKYIERHGKNINLIDKANIMDWVL